MATLVLLLAVLLLSWCDTGQAAIRSVPEEYTTIQQAIDLSAPGDTVVIGPGTWAGTLVIQRDVSLISRSHLEGSDSLDVILDATGWTNGITYSSSTPSVVTLEGLRITGATSGGFQVQWPSSGEFHIRSCRIDHCDLGIGAADFGTMEISNCTLEYIGGHVISLSGGTGEVYNSHLQYGRPLVNVGRGSFVFDRCVIDHVAGFNGGQAIIVGLADVSFLNSVIANNSASYGYERVVGIQHGTTMTIRNSILWGNLLGTYNSLIALNQTVGAPCVLSIDHSTVEGGISRITTGNAQDLVIWDASNRVDDPQFVSGYHLAASSPCIDAGSPASPADPDGTVADMGVYYHCQGQALGHPHSVSVVAEPGEQTGFTIELRTACAPIVIDSVRTGAGSFQILEAPSALPGDYTTGRFRLCFTPSDPGLVTDTLHLWADTPVSNTDDPRHHRIALNGESGPIPLPVQDLAITLLSDRSVLLQWSPVQQTVHGNPVSPGLYLVFSNDGDPLNESDWHYLGATPGNDLIHPLAARFNPRLCYQVVAWVGSVADPAGLGHNLDRTTILRRLRSICYETRAGLTPEDQGASR